jgi:hypothetical protein
MSTPLTSARINSDIADLFLTQKEYIRRWAWMEAHRPYAVLERSHYLRDLYIIFRYAATSIGSRRAIVQGTFLEEQNQIVVTSTQQKGSDHVESQGPLGRV